MKNLQDSQPCIYLQVTAGRGPKECCWVVAQVLNLMRREASENKLALELLNVVAFDQYSEEDASVFKSVQIKVAGQGADKFAERWLGSLQWQGVSPYRPKHKRRNWFVGCEPFDMSNPGIDHQWQSQVAFKAIHASGPGGQHVNKTASAIYALHRPSGIAVKAESERSQHRNKALALEKIAMKLQLQKTVQSAAKEKSTWKQHSDLERGRAIRTFVGKAFVEKTDF